LAPSATIVFMPPQHGGPTVAPMADLFEEYPFGRAWDEMFSAPVRSGPPTSRYSRLCRRWTRRISRRAPTSWDGRSWIRDHFALGGVERPFPLDLIPRIVTAEEWRAVEQGVPQRVRALEAFLADVYGQGRHLRRRGGAAAAVTTSPHFTGRWSDERSGRRQDRHRRRRT